MNKNIFQTLCITCFTLILWITHSVAAQRSNWSTPIELSPPHSAANTDQTRSYGSSWFPDITTDHNGRLAVTWYSGIAIDPKEGGVLDLLMYREYRNGQWTAPIELFAPATGGLTVRHSILAGRDGKLHLFYRLGMAIVYTNAPFAMARFPQSWSEPKRISGSDPTYYVAAATDSKGGLHVIYSENVPDDPSKPNTACSGCSDLFYRRSVDGGQTWSTPINLSQSPDGITHPQIKIDAFDRIHIVWNEGIDTFVGSGQPHRGVYIRSDDGGNSWVDRYYFELPSSAYNALLRQMASAGISPTTLAYPKAVVQTALGVDNQGNPLVVFRGAHYDRIFSQFSPDGGRNWLPAQELIGLVARATTYDNYSLTTDNAGNIHLAACAYQANEQIDTFTPPTLWHLVWSSQRWSMREVIMQNELYPEYPKIITSNGNQLHVVWFTRNRDDIFTSERSKYRVWYSQRSLNIPAATALPTFTPTATIFNQIPITATPTPAPTATPLPANITQAPPMTSRPIWESAALIVIGSSLLIPIALISLIVFVRWRLTRQ